MGTARMVVLTATTDGVPVVVGGSKYLGLQNQGAVNCYLSFDGGITWPGIVYASGGGFGLEADFTGLSVKIKSASSTADVCVTTRTWEE